VFPKPDDVEEELKTYVKQDQDYQSEIAKAYDQSWRLIQKGYIGDALTYQTFHKLPVVDEYRFIRKNFHKAWVLYVLLLRVFSFKNPFKEVSAFLKTRHVERLDEHQTPMLYPDYKDFQSELLQLKPLVSVIIPTLNRYKYLKDVLKDLEQQDYTNFEVILVDQSEPFQKEFYDAFDLKINLIYQEEKALWLARNTAIQQSEGQIIMLSEDDVRIEADWILEHLKCLDYFNTDVSAGPFYPKGSVLPKQSSFFKISSQFATGNVAFYKSIMKETGMFDRQFERQRMGDGEFGLRVYLSGFKSTQNPRASCIDIKANEGGLRQLGSWDAFRSKNLFSPKPVPSVLYYYRKYYGNKAAKFALLKTVPGSIIPYRHKQNSYLKVVGVILSLFISPIVIFQVIKSWVISNKKLKEGAKIRKLFY
jgi:glycosyltransferase involved in cell wall biosynthesis